MLKYIIFILFPIFAQGQMMDDLRVASIQQKNKCEERGHVSGGYVMQTEMYCGSYLIDTDSTTVRVYPSCNSRTYDCIRCYRTITEPVPEQRVVIWRKQ